MSQGQELKVVTASRKVHDGRVTHEVLMTIGGTRIAGRLSVSAMNGGAINENAGLDAMAHYCLTVVPTEEPKL